MTMTICRGLISPTMSTEVYSSRGVRATRDLKPPRSGRLKNIFRARMGSARKGDRD